MDKTKADILYESLANFTDEEGAIECGAKMRDYARELERELATECAINQRNCEDWASDHTYFQNLCRKAGYDEHAVEGDRYGIRSIQQLGDMLLDKIALPNV